VTEQDYRSLVRLAAFLARDRATGERIVAEALRDGAPDADLATVRRGVVSRSRALAPPRPVAPGSTALRFATMGRVRRCGCRYQPSAGMARAVASRTPARKLVPSLLGTLDRTPGERQSVWGAYPHPREPARDSGRVLKSQAKVRAALEHDGAQWHTTDKFSEPPGVPETCHDLHQRRSEWCSHCGSR
jgi:hypothetical protein